MIKAYTTFCVIEFYPIDFDMFIGIVFSQGADKSKGEYIGAFKILLLPKRYIAKTIDGLKKEILSIVSDIPKDDIKKLREATC